MTLAIQKTRTRRKAASRVNASGGASIDSGRSFFNSSSGRWAGERLLAAIKAGRPLSTNELRTLDTLQRDEWIHFDDQLIAEAPIRAGIVADLIDAGLVMNIPNAMGKTMIQFENVSDMDPAVVSLDGLARSDNDRVTYEPGNVPLPIIHKDFNIGLRTLSASRTSGEALDTTQVRVSGRLVMEKIADMFFNGGPTFGGAPIYGLRTHPNRNTGTFGTGGNWSQVAKTGEQIFNDLVAAVAALQADRFHGPYWAYIPSAYSTEITDDYKATSDKSTRTRLLEIDGLERIEVADQLPANELIVFQATSDVVQLGNGVPLQTIQWDIYGGMAIAFKAFAIQVPVIRADPQSRSGVYHMS